MCVSLVEWLVTYNSIRPHHSLGLRTPLVAAQESGLVSRESPAATRDYASLSAAKLATPRRAPLSPPRWTAPSQ